MKQEVELLAPAGSFEILKAVLAAGADAVYVGGSSFGARAYADNFTQEELLQAIDYVHLRGKKLYLTVNTLLKNAEIKEQLYAYLLPYYERGLDAVIVQDFGALTFIKAHFPDLPLHTSTQMTITAAAGAKLLKESGAERVVLARELSIAEMKQIRKEADIELEAFVHGALCYSYSGQCLFSSMLGGRSGNRGRCAQPCRLPYTVLDETKTICKKDTYILSLKDLCGIAYLKQLREAGVYSFKIEGRMKQLSYAAGVVSFYRKYLDLETQVSQEDMQHLYELGNRCGFTDVYFQKRNDKRMVTFEKPSYEKSNEALHQEMEQSYGSSKNQLPVCGTLLIQKGQPLVFYVNNQQAHVSLSLGMVQEAKNKPLEEADVIERMKKTGELPFYFEEFYLQMDKGVFVPNGVLNQLRRDTLAKLEEELLSGFFRKTAVQTIEEQQLQKFQTEAPVQQYLASCQTREQWECLLHAAEISAIYMDAQMYSKKSMRQELPKDVWRTQQAGKSCFLRLPAVFREDTSVFYAENKEMFTSCGLDGVVLRNYEQLYFFRKEFPELPIVLDYHLYTYNDYAKAAFFAYAAAGQVLRDTIPLELNQKEIRNRQNSGSEMLIYGHYPLMISAGCVHKNAALCDRQPQISYLKDRYQVLFPVKNYCEDCYNIIYNSVPLVLFSEQQTLQQYGIHSFRLEFTIETAEETANVLQLLHGKGRQIAFTKGHYKRGVE